MYYEGLSHDFMVSVRDCRDLGYSVLEGYPSEHSTAQVVPLTGSSDLGMRIHERLESVGSSDPELRQRLEAMGTVFMDAIASELAGRDPEL